MTIQAELDRWKTRDDRLFWSRASLLTSSRVGIPTGELVQLQESLFLLPIYIGRKEQNMYHHILTTTDKNGRVLHIYHQKPILFVKDSETLANMLLEIVAGE